VKLCTRKENAAVFVAIVQRLRQDRIPSQKAEIARRKDLKA